MPNVRRVMVYLLLCLDALCSWWFCFELITTLEVAMREARMCVNCGFASAAGVHNKKCSAKFCVEHKIRLRLVNWTDTEEGNLTFFGCIVCFERNTWER